MGPIADVEKSSFTRALVVLAALLAGCSGGARSVADPAPPAPAPSDPPAPAALTVQERVKRAIEAWQAGEHDEAFRWLERAMAGGLSPAFIARFPPLEPMTADPRYADLAARFRTPCDTPERRQFDFWIGTWDVKTGDGTVVGTNVIERAEGGCILTESWTASSGGTGRSVNFYDPGAGRWKQIWTDGGGRIIHYVGGLRDDGAMHFEGDLVLPDGTRLRSRMTFTPDAEGRVRQVIENSGNGKTWQPWFDGLYTRR